MGQPILSSVDGQVTGRVIDSRKDKTHGAFVVDMGVDRVRQLCLGPLSLPDPAGIEKHGQRPPGFPRNLRAADVSIELPVEETGTQDLPAPGASAPIEKSEQWPKRWYRLVKNPKRAETGVRETERPPIIVDAGEPHEGPRGEKGRHVMTPLEGHMAGASKRRTMHWIQYGLGSRVRGGLLIHSQRHLEARSCVCPRQHVRMWSPRGAIPWSHPARSVQEHSCPCCPWPSSAWFRSAARPATRS